jgi:hypothetical protein
MCLEPCQIYLHHKYTNIENCDKCYKSMSTNPDLDDFVVRAFNDRDDGGMKLIRIQQKEPLVIDATAGGTQDVNVVGGTLTTSPLDGPSLDAFQRSRVSNPVTLFESSMEVDSQDLVWVDDSTGSGSSAYNTDQSSVTLSTGAASSSYIRQSRQYTRYQPGKSLLVFFTFVLGTRATDVTRRVGYFDVDNGVFLEQTGTDIAWVVRSNTTGSPVDTRIVQASWDIDTLDGAGTSGLTLSETSANIGIIDLEWLGVGRIRAGFVINGQIYYAHGFENLGVDEVYMSRASLPMRYEIVSGAGASGSSDLLQICSTVISEGGFVPRGMVRSASTGAATRTVGAVTRLPLVAVRLKAAYSRATVFPVQLEVGNTSGSMCHMEVRMRATVTGGSWVSVSEAMEANITGTSLTGGVVVVETYVDKNKSIGSLSIEDTTLVNASDYLGTTSDEMVITALSLSGNVNVAAALMWREIF